MNRLVRWMPTILSGINGALLSALFGAGLSDWRFWVMVIVFVTYGAFSRADEWQRATYKS